MHHSTSQRLLARKRAGEQNVCGVRICVARIVGIESFDHIARFWSAAQVHDMTAYYDTTSKQQRKRRALSILHCISPVLRFKDIDQNRSNSRLSSTFSLTTPALTSLSPFFGTTATDPSTFHPTLSHHCPTSFSGRSSHFWRCVRLTFEKQDETDVAKRFRRALTRYGCFGRY